MSDTKVINKPDTVPFFMHMRKDLYDLLVKEKEKRGFSFTVIINMALEEHYGVGKINKGE